jgi:single-stranded-DNA-specific exonuclease
MAGFGADPFLGVTRSATGRAWRSRLDGEGEMRAVAIHQRHGVSVALARVLAGRGVGTDAAPGYLSPSLRQDMPDPSALMDMDAAAARLADAAEAGEPVAIFGDYDVDGAASAALLSEALSFLGCPTRIYIPDRLFEGYGPNPAAIDRLVEGGARLVVTVDCGVSSFPALERARERGADVVVIDHHQVESTLPPAVAIVNPNRPDDLSGLGYLSAVGVTFLVVAALVRELRRRGRFANGRSAPDLLRLLDLVALGTVCDMVPLVGLNRAFAQKGLLAIRQGLRPGLAALALTARLKGPCEAYHLGFLIGPRINAGGRIGDAALGARLLSSADHGEVEAIAARLDRLNRERQGIEAAAVAEALDGASIGPDDERPALVLSHRDGWHPGVVGLVAARLKERFDRPAFAIAFSPGAATGTGSGRSIPGVDLSAAVRAALEAGLLVKGGGHAMAAGLTVARDRLPDLAAFLEDRLAADIGRARMARARAIDGLLTATAATADLVEDLERAGPFGSGNPDPLFAFPAHRIAYAEVVGSGHVRARLMADAGAPLKAIAFGAADGPLGRALLAARGRPIHALGTLAIDSWGGTRRPQLRIVDVAEAAGRL